MTKYHTTGRAVCNVACGTWAGPPGDRRFVPNGEVDYLRKYGSDSPFIYFAPIVRRSWMSRVALRIRRSRWIEVDVPEAQGSPEQKWRVSVTACRGETDTEILEGAHDHVRAELEILEALVQWRRDVPVVTRPVAWTYRLPEGTHLSCVYFLRNGSRVKIGTTTHLRNRVRRLSLRPDNVALIVPGGRNEEQLFHQRFSSHRVGSTEWFEDDGALRNFIESERKVQRT